MKRLKTEFVAANGTAFNKVRFTYNEIREINSTPHILLSTPRDIIDGIYVVIPISVSKLIYLCKKAKIVYGLIGKSISVVEDTETGKVEIFYVEDYALKQIAKRSIIDFDTVLPGQELIFNGPSNIEPFKTVDKGGYKVYLVRKYVNANGVDFVELYLRNQGSLRNQGGSMFLAYAQNTIDKHIVNTNPGLTDEELATML